MRIATDFEGARIEVLAAERGAPIRLAIPPDPAHPRFRQWFAFAVEGAAGEPLAFAIENAGSCTWPRAWTDYRVCATHDGEAWFRVPTTYADGVLRFEDTPGGERASYAYLPPCSNARIDAVVARAAAAGARTRSLVRTEGGRDVMLVELGRESSSAPVIWIVAQQHPGEHMAGFWVEGFVDALLARGTDARALLSAATVALVPRINPDGVAIGAHRTNAAGIDMNRQWLAPDAKAPEVAAVRAAMQARGCAFFLDVHGDEVIPYVFAQGTEGVPMRTPRAAGLEADFLVSLGAASPDLQTVHGYPKDAPGKANLRIAANWAADLFDALSFTLEMPFIDNANRPDARAGWSIERCRALGAAFVPALAATLPRLGGRRVIPALRRGTLAPVSPISAPGLAGESNAVPERVVRACGRIAEALFHDGEAPPPAERVAWLEGDVRDFLGRATGRARVMFRLCVFVIVWLGPLWALSLPPLTRLTVAARIAVLERLERSPLGFAFFGAKALLCLMYYEHPDAARELGFDGHASGVARPASSLVRGKR